MGERVGWGGLPPGWWEEIEGNSSHLYTTPPPAPAMSSYLFISKSELPWLSPTFLDTDLEGRVCSLPAALTHGPLVLPVRVHFY